MERNLYAPPAAPVADPVETVGDRPAQVAWAVWLLWVSVTIGVMASVLQVTVLFSINIVIYILAVNLARSAVAAWLILKTGEGRNWARILLLVGVLLNLGLIAYRWQVYIGSFKASSLLGAATWISKLALDWTAVVLLFTPTANRWFKQ
jgi:hypothetical protein